MGNLMDDIDKKLAECKTSKDLYDAYAWLAARTYELISSREDMQRAIIDLYGENGLEDVYQKMESYEPEKSEVEKLAEYGYVKGGMCIVPMEAAKKFLQDGNDVYVLYPDNTEKKITSMEELQNVSDKLFAMKEEDMERRVSELVSSIYGDPDRD